MPGAAEHSNRLATAICSMGSPRRGGRPESVALRRGPARLPVEELKHIVARRVNPLTFAAEWLDELEYGTALEAEPIASPVAVVTHRSSIANSHA